MGGKRPEKPALSARQPITPPPFKAAQKRPKLPCLGLAYFTRARFEEKGVA